MLLLVQLHSPGCQTLRHAATNAVPAPVLLTPNPTQLCNPQDLLVLRPFPTCNNHPLLLLLSTLDSMTLHLHAVPAQYLIQ